MLKRLWMPLRARSTSVPSATPYSCKVGQANKPPMQRWYVGNARELRSAILKAKAHDVIIITRTGNYGAIGVVDKQYLTLCGYNATVALQMHITVAGQSRCLTLEHLKIWHSEGTQQAALISVEADCQAITIQHCQLGSTPNAHSVTSSLPSHDWVKGMLLQGSGHQILHNRLSHITTGIEVHSSHSIISRNTLTHFTHKALHLQAQQLEVTHNKISDAVMGQNTHLPIGIYRHESVQHLHLHANTLKLSANLMVNSA